MNEENRIELNNSEFNFYSENNIRKIKLHMGVCFSLLFSLRINENNEHRMRALKLIEIFYSTEENLGNNFLNSFKRLFEGVNDNSIVGTSKSISELSDDTFKCVLNIWIENLNVWIDN